MIAKPGSKRGLTECKKSAKGAKNKLIPLELVVLMKKSNIL